MNAAAVLAPLLARGLREAGAIGEGDALVELVDVRCIHEGEQSAVARAEALIAAAGGSQLQRRVPLILKHVDISSVSTLALKSSESRSYALRSFANEYSFLCMAAPLLRARAVPGAGDLQLRIPLLYAADAVEGRWSYALERIDWRQRSELDAVELRSVLSALACFHASFFHLSKNERAAVRAAVWPRGCWWTVEKRPPEQAARLREDWAAVVAGFGMASAAAAELAPRLHARLPVLARAVDALFGGFVTLLHGDLKTGNVLLGPAGEAAVVDFQWTGMGPPILDVGYLLLSSASLGALEGAGEGPFLEHYAVALRAALPAAERPRAPGADELRAQFELLTLDYVRAAAKYLAAVGGPAACAANAAAPDALNMLVQERSAAHVIKLAAQAVAALPRLEALPDR